MFRNIVIVSFLFVLLAGVSQRALSQGEVETTLGRAQALYYEAKFNDSVQLLLPVDAALGQRTDRVSQRINVKLQLALGYIGQNQMDKAKSVFQEVCVLDETYSLDASQFAPKVLALFDDAKTEQKKSRCQTYCTTLDAVSRAGNAQELLKLAKDAGGGCACPAAAAAADLLYAQGIEAYKKSDFAPALEKLRAALKFRPQHDLALQYTELAEDKIKLTVDRLVFDWRKSFEAHEFPKAAALYRDLESLNIDGKATVALEQGRGEYRKAVTAAVETWSQSCTGSAPVSLDALRQQTKDLLPNEAIAADILANLTPCAPKPSPAQAPEVTAVAPQECLQMASQLALVRLKSRVNPEISPERAPVTPVEIKLKVRIDEEGNVGVKDASGSNRYLNEAMRVAVEKWKFSPAMVGDQRRCVETELPVVLSRS
jgi:tetratricopeptide (TPR) repeat protein